VTRFLERWLATALLALALPGLLAPGNLDFSICLCAPVSSAAEPAPCCVRKCCESEQEQGPTAAQDHEHCGGCRDVATQRRDDATPARAHDGSPLALLPAPAICRAVACVPDLSFARVPSFVSRAAPPRPPPLPLRI
jgi:hypothetical protein